MQEIKTYFGRNLKKIRKEKGYSQECLAEKAGIFRRQLTRIETGKSFPSFKTLDSLCEALNVTPNELFDFRHFKSETKIENKDTISDTDILISEIQNKINVFSENIPKLKFIQLSILCLEDKKYIEKMQNILTGMLI